MNKDQQQRNVLAKMLTEAHLNRRRFLIGAGTSAAVLSLPISLSGVAEAASDASRAATLPPPILFPGNGIGARFSSYSAPTMPWNYTFKADVYDHLYFPGQKAALDLNLSNPGAGSLTVAGSVVVAFATEAIGDSSGGVELLPIEVLQTIPVPQTVLAPGATSTLHISYDFSLPTVRKGIYALYAYLQDPTSASAPTYTVWLGNIGLIEAPTPGFKEKSFFMADFRSSDKVSMTTEANSLQKMGVKWIRNGYGADNQEPQQGVYNWTDGDMSLDVMQQHELYCLWLTIGTPDWMRDGVTYTVRTGWNAPDLAIPDSHLADYQAYWVEFMKHYKGSVIKAINFWNEPWEGGGISGWGGTGQTYRHMLKAVYDGVKSVDPTMLIGADDSDDNINDILLPDTNWQQLFDLGTQHGLAPQGFYMQKLLPFEIWQTESWYMAQLGQLVQQTMFSLAGGRTKVNNVVLGNFFSNAGEAGGYYGYDANSQFSPQPSAITYSTMTHLLEDTVFVEEPHPDRNPFVFLFKGQAGVKTNKHVAVLFGFPTDPTWVQQWQINGKGQMRLPDPHKQVQALDAYGNPYQRSSDHSYTLPFDITPIFLTAASLDALRDTTDAIVVTATSTPVRIVLDDITRPLEDHAVLPVSIINPLHQRLTGTVQVTLPAGWSADSSQFTFHNLKPGETARFNVRLKSASYNDANQYPVTVKVITPIGTMTWKESVEVHVIAYGTPNIGQGTAQDEWQRLGVHPILIGSTTPPAGSTQTNWSYALSGLTYDDKNLYFITAVNTPNQNPSVDQTGTWFTLIPPGYGYADGPNWPFSGDNVELAINCYDNKEDYLYPRSNPYHYRYPSRETDYLFGFYQPKGTAGQVWRYRIPGMPWRHRYPFTPFEQMQQLVDPEVKLTVTTSGNWITYWATLPLSLLSHLEARPEQVIKLAVKNSNSNIGDVYSSQGRSSSRIDVQAFQPYWAGGYSVDTLWGFGKKPAPTS